MVKFKTQNIEDDWKKIRRMESPEKAILRGVTSKNLLKSLEIDLKS